MLRRDHRDLDRLRRRLADPPSPPPRARPPVRDTAPERTVAALLDRLGVRYEAQRRLLPNVTVDFFLPECGLVVECQGRWYHADPELCDPRRLRPGQARTVAHDRALRRWVDRAGLRLLELWEEDLARRPEWCLGVLRESLAGGTPGAGSMSTCVRTATLAGGVRLAIHHGDLTGETVDAIVNAANSQLQHGSGLAGAIVRAGGRVIQEASDIWVERHGPVPTGSVALTGAGGLAAQAVIHAVGPIWRGGAQGESEALRSAVRASLDLASERGYASIALPALSSGIFGFPKPLCAEILVDAALAFVAAQPDGPLREIRLTNFDRPTVDLFVAEFDRRLGPQA